MALSTLSFHHIGYTFLSLWLSLLSVTLTKPHFSYVSCTLFQSRSLHHISVTSSTPYFGDVGYTVHNPTSAPSPEVCLLRLVFYFMCNNKNRESHGGKKRGKCFYFTPFLLFSSFLIFIFYRGETTLRKKQAVANSQPLVNRGRKRSINRFKTETKMNRTTTKMQKKQKTNNAQKQRESKLSSHSPLAKARGTQKKK